MSLVDFFDAARALKRELTGETLSQADVDAFNAVITRWNAPQSPPDAPPSATSEIPLSDSLHDAAAFYGDLKGSFGPLAQTQVDGTNRLLSAFGAAAWPIAYVAYGLATARKETNATFQPVREAYWLSEEWRKSHLKYWPWYGRGFVQLTWEKNYARADNELGLAGALIADPDKALEPDIAAMIIVRGMAEGWFSGKRLGDYLPSGGPADIHQFTNARWIINGQDHAVDIAEVALHIQSALQAGGWQ